MALQHATARRPSLKFRTVEGLLLESLRLRGVARALRGLQPFDASTQVCRSLWIRVDLPQIPCVEEAKLRRGNGARRQRVQHQCLADGVAERPFGVRGK